MSDDYSIKDIYQGGYSSLEPSVEDTPTRYRMSAGSFGLTTDPRNANVLQEVSSKLSTGVKQIEVSAISPDIFESIPNRDLKEINRLSKLTGVDISVHGPIIEASGMTKEGFTESGRIAAERQMNSAVERSHEINPDGNIPVTFHSSAILPGMIKQKEDEEVAETYIINPESGQINKIPLKKRSFHGEGDMNVEKELEKINEDGWNNQITNLGYATERANSFIQDSNYLKHGADAEKRDKKELSPEEERASQMYDIGENYLKDSYRKLKELYETVNNYGTDKDKIALQNLNSRISSKVDEINNIPDNGKKIILMQEVIKDGLDTMTHKIPIPPQIYESLDKFTKEKTIETFGNVAFNSYKKFGDKAPIISIENPPVGQAFSRGGELKKIVEESRKKFVERAVKEGISESDAKLQAEKLLGVTWDVGHINMLRKHGYEDKDIVKETGEVAPLVKHVHLSDNFGFEHTELPMGMGNVPIKEIMEKLGKKGFEAKKIIEAGNWWQHFKSPPVQETLEAFGSPIYSMKMTPYWNQAYGMHQGYFSGYGQMLPQTNYETFGAGFSQLPAELGGQRHGAEGSRMSNRGME